MLHWEKTFEWRGQEVAYVQVGDIRTSDTGYDPDDYLPFAGSLTFGEETERFDIWAGSWPRRHPVVGFRSAVLWLAVKQWGLGVEVRCQRV